MFSRRNPTSAYGSTRPNYFSSSTSGHPRLSPPKGWKIALVVTSISLLLIIEVVVVVPMLDPSVPGMTLFTYKPQGGNNGGNGGEFAVGSCQIGNGSGGVQSLPCIESLAKTDIQGGFSNVPVILKLSSVWIGIFLGCLFLAVDAWSGLRRSGYHTQNQSMSSYGQQQGAGMYGQSKKGVLVVHLVVAILFFFLWLMTAIWTASTPGVGAQPLGVAYLIMTPLFTLTWLVPVFMGAFKAAPEDLTAQHGQQRSGYW
ncbi:hypothetical protein HD553DRAFT_314762 [Filobasidium floriforme]|uniref:uncharacterized protein n=1 Tax=Filobasidium floriforme TaxID=5210 RepID=UPI001E8DE464|nr:uncharacterized protein HD553DRAFT_314762 [Filobasidium floriforme]KAH8082385.1 hypothetical protein HD553DRAFT_314762 [Filobasidium floriforme]